MIGDPTTGRPGTGRAGSGGVGLRSERGPILGAVMLATGLIAVDSTAAAGAGVGLSGSGVGLPPPRISGAGRIVRERGAA